MIQRLCICVFISVLTSLPILSNAEVYTWINADGVREYGDEPPKDAQKADLPKIQSLPKEVFAKQKEADKSKSSEAEFSGYRKLAILTPKQDTSILSGSAGTLQVELTLEPSLQAGHEVTLFLNGKSIAQGAQLHFSLNNLDRGSHMIHAHVKHQGVLLVSSPKRRFHVQRPSILNRSRAQ